MPNISKNKKKGGLLPNRKQALFSKGPDEIRKKRSFLECQTGPNWSGEGKKGDRRKGGKLTGPKKKNDQ